jgi:two-component system copper resistance phosphate regulon response regulator CusR
MNGNTALTDLGRSSSDRRPFYATADTNRSTKKHILIVDDDVSLSGFLSTELQGLSHAVDLLHDGEAAIESLQKRQYDLLILELNLPKIDGLNLLQLVRLSNPKLPVLVLTVRSRVEDRVSALHSGADDCLTKPFSLLELTARIGALMRRNVGVIPNVSVVDDLALYRDEHRIERNGRRINLTPREFAMLEFLMRSPGRPIARATLFEEVWRMPYASSTNIVDVYMKYIRDKVDLPGEPKLTHTIRGVGYEIRSAPCKVAEC